MSFRVGMEVVCIRERKWRGVFSEKCAGGPKKGEIVVVSGVHDFGSWGRGIMLCGYPSGNAYNTEHFRPVVKRKTDISVLEKLLDTKTIEELV